LTSRGPCCARKAARDCGLRKAQMGSSTICHSPFEHTPCTVGLASDLKGFICTNRSQIVRTSSPCVVHGDFATFRDLAIVQLQAQQDTSTYVLAIDHQELDFELDLRRFNPPAFISGRWSLTCKCLHFTPPHGQLSGSKGLGEKTATIISKGSDVATTRRTPRRQCLRDMACYSPAANEGGTR
jgi:hypothetical protein